LLPVLIIIMYLKNFLMEKVNENLPNEIPPERAESRNERFS